MDTLPADGPLHDVCRPGTAGSQRRRHQRSDGPVSDDASGDAAGSPEPLNNEHAAHIQRSSLANASPPFGGAGPTPAEPPLGVGPGHQGRVRKSQSRFVGGNEPQLPPSGARRRGGQRRLAELAYGRAFLAELDRAAASLADYLSGKGWFMRVHPDAAGMVFAYFFRRVRARRMHPELRGRIWASWRAIISSRPATPACHWWGSACCTSAATSSST